jgi:biotin-dependent carboxylase-like uncharacterized protein
VLRVCHPATTAVTGAPCAVRVDGRPAAWGAPVRLAAGSLLEVGPATHGVRSYLAFAGGIAVEPVLGSRSTDLLSGLGPAPLAAGDSLPLGESVRPPAAADVAPWPAPPKRLILPLLLGPRDDWFTAHAVTTLAARDYVVSTASNRIGLRMDGPVLEHTRDEELPSEGMVLGAVQVPPNGRPVVFLADHPTTGGYPVIGVVPATALPGAAQAAPGTPVRFVPQRTRRRLSETVGRLATRSVGTANWCSAPSPGPCRIVSCRSADR